MKTKYPLLLTLASISMLGGSIASAHSDIDKTAVTLKQLGYNPSIVGGENANKGEFPWIASIQLNGEHDCGGSLVAEGWILTAAHCTTGRYTTSNIKVKLGAHAQDDNAGVSLLDVTQIVNHPDYNDSNGLHYDVALLKVSGDTSGFSKIQLADSALMNSSVKVGTMATVAGWGRLSSGGTLPNILQKVDVPVVSNATCSNSYPGSGRIASDNLCAGYAEGGKDSCQGDSGGPLFIRHSGKHAQIGIVSWGEGCADANKYGVYAKVSEIKSWITNNTGNVVPPSGGGSISKPDLSGDRDSSSHYSIKVPAGKSELNVKISGGSGDADLYVNFGSQASQDVYECAPFEAGNDENCTINNPNQGTYHIMIHGYEAYSGVKLEASSK